MKPSELIATPDKWTRRGFARDKKHKVVYYKSDEAVCFCVRGAIRACGFACDDSDYTAKRLGFKNLESLTQWNDDPRTTHAEVLARLKGAGL